MSAAQIYSGERYLNWTEVMEECRRLAHNNPQWVTMTEIGKSHLDRPIILLTIGWNDGLQDDRPGFWLDGGTHASEWTGIMSAVYTAGKWIDALRQGRSSEQAYFKANTAYVVPCISPDGFSALCEGHPFVRSGLRPRPNEQHLVGFEPQDIDGDGCVRWMRWKHPSGSFVPDPDIPMFMRPRTLTDDPDNAYFFCSEGLFLNWDGHAWVQAPRRFGLDLNRNFPAHWSPFSMFGMDGGTYALSEPESRAVVDAFAQRKRIGAGLTNHTYTGCILTQPYRDDTPMSDNDIRLFERLAHQSVHGTPYRVFRTVPDFSYDKTKAIVGVWSDTLSTTFGVPGYTLELWDPFGYADVDNENPIDFFMRPDPQKIGQMVKAFSQIEGAVSPWNSFEHPQLGHVEIGGLDYLKTIRNPPEALLKRECDYGFTVANQLKQALPQIKVEVKCESLGNDSTRIEVRFDNQGFLSTACSERGEGLPMTPTVNASLSLDGHLALSYGAPEVELPHLDGWGSTYPSGPHSIYPSLGARGTRAQCSWIVSGSGRYTIAWSGGRGGKGQISGTIS